MRSWKAGLVCSLLIGGCAASRHSAPPARTVLTEAHTPSAARSVHRAAPEPAGPESKDAARVAESAAAPGPTVVIELADVPYRFELRFERVFDADAAYFDCDSGPALLRVTRRDDAAFAQEFPLDQICVVRDADGGALVNGTALYDDQGMLQIGDFDFDGSPDFAVQDGNDSCYRGPSYSVFLFDRKSGSFSPSADFTALAREWCGFFVVDAQKRELRTSTKSGCCWHLFVRWKVVKGVPEQVYRLTVEHTAGAVEGEWVAVETEERLERGRWIERVTRKVEKH